MQQFLQQILEALIAHWAKILLPLVGIVFGAWWGKRRARREWARRQFLNRINVSLNLLDDGYLRLRTLSEKNLDEVFLNKVAVDEVLAAAQRTTEQNPLLPVPRQDAWYLLNAVLNEISEQFAVGHLKRDMGLPVQRETYVAALTYEVSGSLKTRKVRAMLIQKKRLLDLPPECPKLESPHHEIRFRTLQTLAEHYRRDPSQFIEVEIVV